MGRKLQTEHDAVLRDTISGVFTDPRKLHEIAHDGPHFQVNGIHLCEPSPQRTPLLFQAGSSQRGRSFAARHAECVFINGPSKASASKTVEALRQAARDAERDPCDITIFLAANVVIAPSTAEANELYEEYSRYIDAVGQLTLVSGWTGIDLSGLQPDDVVPFANSNAIRSTAENLTTKAPKPVHIRDLSTLTPTGARAPFFVGTASEVADSLIAWADETGVDGFNIPRLSVPTTLRSVVDQLVPELQSRTRFRTRYHEGTLREKFYEGSGAHLKANHVGRRL